MILSVLAADFSCCQFSCKLFQWQVLACMDWCIWAVS